MAGNRPNCFPVTPAVNEAPVPFVPFAMAMGLLGAALLALLTAALRLS